MDDASEAMRRMRRQLSSEEYAEDKLNQFEEKCVAKILKSAMFPSDVAAELFRIREYDPNNLVTFASFNATVDRFPSITIRGAVRDKLRWALPDFWGKEFLKNPAIRAYQDLAANEQIDLTQRWFAMVIRFRAASQKIVVVHNYTGSPADRDKVDARLTRSVNGINYVVESFDSFVAAIGTGWAD